MPLYGEYAIPRKETGLPLLEGGEDGAGAAEEEGYCVGAGTGTTGEADEEGGGGA